MNLSRFDEILFDDAKNIVCQNWKEWRAFLQLSYSHLWDKDMLSPVVVELGVEHGGQKAYYEELLGATHFGIDKDTSKSQPDIVGDVLEERTISELQMHTDGKPINLLFIDLWVQLEHYDTVKACYEIYGQMTDSIIAIHSVCCRGSAQERLWGEIMKTQSSDTKVTIWNQYPVSHKWHITPMGIGVVLKGEKI